MACTDCMKASDFSIDKKGIKKRNWRTRIRYLLKITSSSKSMARRRSYRPTVDEVNQWAQSLDKLLSHKYGKAAFRIFLKSEFCEENIEFWTACEEFRTISSLEKLSSRARSIYEEFIQCDAPKEINLDYQTKDAIIQSLCLPSLTCFLLAQKKVFSLMENNSYPRFIHSELYKELCAIARGEGQYLKS
ncbi:regulator of G-protein signaling 2 [Salmo salar]|uniref:Regulator of G-protein signaling 2 n=1 Tax=Salmo salar TaxID=8030 RepID=B9EN10_SALSA|nr:regulator of G-protein signaling 2 [Salmo salar]ACM08907.1 Regulator of G-protein signaling 2 [Salmo salar]|eukprot:XP_014024405.1 PREDICTED: regulator of G-protein signaling 2-like [Salmo salar]